MKTIAIILVITTPFAWPTLTLAYYEARLLFKGEEIARCRHQFGAYFTVGHNVICRDIYR